MKLIEKAKELYARTSSGRFVKYLRSRGVAVGKNTSFMNPMNAIVDLGRSNYINIGDNCVFAPGVTIMAHDYSWKNLVLAYGEVLPSGGKPIHIGNNVFMGVNSTILGGVSIGNNSIIAAGAVVSTSIPDNVVAGGIPAKPIMSLDEYREKQRNKLLQSAIQDVKYLYKRFNRKPTIEELKNYAVLFLPREKNEYLKNVTVGIDNRTYIQCVVKTEPLFESYETFIEYALKEHE